MQSDRGIEHDRLLREAEERIRQRRAALGIEVKVPTVEPAPPSPLPGSASDSPLPGPGVEGPHFTQDTQDTDEPLDTHDTKRTHAEAAGAAGPGGDGDGDELETGYQGTAVPDLNLPLDRYVEEAGRAEEAWIEEQQYDSTGNVDWKAGWHFVRLLKCHPELRDLKTLDALSKVRAAILRASKRRPSYRVFPGVAFDEVIGGFLTDTIDEFDAHFVRNWKAVRYLPGESPLQTAVHLANKHPLSTHAAKGSELPQYRRLVSIAGWLQYVVGERNILLPVHKLGPILGCTPRSISTYIRMAEEEEILERVQRHLPKTRKAHEFRFRTEYWKILSDGPP